MGGDASRRRLESFITFGSFPRREDRCSLRIGVVTFPELGSTITSRNRPSSAGLRCDLSRMMTSRLSSSTVSNPEGAQQPANLLAPLHPEVSGDCTGEVLADGLAGNIRSVVKIRRRLPRKRVYWGFHWGRPRPHVIQSGVAALCIISGPAEQLISQTSHYGSTQSLA